MRSEVGAQGQGLGDVEDTLRDATATTRTICRRPAPSLQRAAAYGWRHSGRTVSSVGRCAARTWPLRRVQVEDVRHALAEIRKSS